ncbi:MAG: hypothetical protein HY921_00150 [Elusimicrobia bacterium]|nr:hypothetical protein [Elusimicrobiota bacterium]
MKFGSKIYALALGLSLALSLGLRCYYVFGYMGFNETVKNIGGDAGDYLQIAYTLAKTGQYARPANVSAGQIKAALAEGRPLEVRAGYKDSYRPPLWPLLLALFLKISGYKLKTLFLLRFLLDAGSLIMLTRLALLLNLSPLLACLAPLYFAVHPTSLLYSGTLLSEPLSMFLQLSLALGTCYCLFRQAPRGWSLGLGALGGLSALAHPFSLFFPLFLGAGLYGTKRISLKALFGFLLGLALSVSPWLIRNRILYGKTFLTTSSGNVLASSWNSTFLQRYRNTTAEVMLDPDPIPGAESLGAAERCSAYSHAAFKFMRENWHLVPAIAARKIVGAATPIPETPREGILEKGRALFQVIAFLPVLWLLILPGAGLFRLILASVAGGYLAMAVLTYPSIRFRAPLIWAETLAVFVWLDLMAKRYCQNSFQE